MTKDIFITNFFDPMFMTMFRRYFDELEMKINDWDRLFLEMNTQNGGNCAYIRVCGDNPIGFIQFTTVTLENWFFKEKLGFIREFWIQKEFRRNGHGSALCSLAEKYFFDNGIRRIVLTAEEEAKEFYFRRGYGVCKGMEAMNNMDVWVKEI